VTAENIENYITEDKLKDTTAVFEILDKYINWQAGTREDLIALMSQEVRDYPEFARTINNFIAIDPAVTKKKKATLWADSMIEKNQIGEKNEHNIHAKKRHPPARRQQQRCKRHGHLSAERKPATQSRSR
jgi:hypothetical protein